MILVFLVNFFVAKSDIDKHLSYLANRGIIQESDLSFYKKNSLVKRDLVFLFYKILKKVDLEKANKEDLQIIENLIKEIIENLQNLKELYINFQDKVAQKESRLNIAYEKIDNLFEEISNLKREVDEVKLRHSNYENNFMNKINIFMDKVKLDIDFTIMYNSNHPISSTTKFKLHDDNLFFDLYHSNFAEGLLYLDFKYKHQYFNLYFASENLKRIFLSSRSREFYNKKGACIGIESDYAKLYLFKNESLDFLLRLSFFTLDVDLAYNKDLDSEFSVKIPILANYKTGLGMILKNIDVAYFIAFFELNNPGMLIKVNYFHSKDHDITIMPYFIFDIPNGFIGGSATWALQNLSKPIEKILLNILTEVYKLKISLVAVFKKNLYLSLSLVTDLSPIKLGINFYSEQTKDLKTGFLAYISFDVAYSTSLLFQYYLFSADIEEETFDIKGGRFTTLGYEGKFKKTSPYGEYSLGLKWKI